MGVERGQKKAASRSYSSLLNVRKHPGVRKSEMRFGV